MLHGTVFWKEFEFLVKFCIGCNVAYIAKFLEKMLHANSLAQVQIYYNGMSYSEMREISIVSFDTVLSQIGGILGLWLGISVVSIIHIGIEGWRFLMGPRTLAESLRKTSTAAGHNAVVQ